MLASLFRRKPDPGEPIRAAVIEASRAPRLYRDLGVPDTLEGRFESLALHAVLVVRQLRRGGPAGEAAAQALVDALFAGLERDLREMGVSDIGVPKRMQRLAGEFYGRVKAYEAALDAPGEDALRAAVARNLLGDADHPGAAALAAYARAAEAALAPVPAADLAVGRLPPLAGGLA